MKELIWQLTQPIDAVVFDCDGTLTHIEGIDELAIQNGVGDEVCVLTARAMRDTGITPDVYQHRLSLVKPSLQQLEQLAQIYYAHRTVDITHVIKLFQQYGKVIYIISAGINPAVKIFGELLGIPEDHIFAVDVNFDENGEYVDYDNNAYPTKSNGKVEIIHMIKRQHPSILYVGDGMNDVAVRDLVDRFVGYGGAYYRKNIADLCQFYIKSVSMLPLLPLSLVQNEYSLLMGDERELYLKGMRFIEKDDVIIKDMHDPNMKCYTH